MRLGLVSYNLARGWDLATVIGNCEETGFEGVELRTTHAHGVEVEMSVAERAEVASRFADSAVTIAGLVIHEAQTIPTQGQVFSFHGFRFEVMQRIDNRITRLRVRPL